MLREGGLVAELRRRGVAATWRATLREEPQAPDPVEAVAGICRSLAALAESLLRERAPLAVIGGDHSIAIGTWSGVARALAGPVGLVWIDAHLDSHVPETTPSGAIHGMPLAALFGYGDRRLTSLARATPALEPWHVAIVGARSYETGEFALLKRLGVQIFFMDEVAARGLATVLDEALAIAGTGTAGIGLSVDCDSVDPEDAPGVGTPVPGGVSGGYLVAALRPLADELAAVEVVEFNPRRDRDGRTAALVADLLAATARPQRR